MNIKEMTEAINELQKFKREAMVRNLDIVKQQTQFAKDLENIIEGCMKLLDTLVAHGDRMDEMSARIDIANKRLRKLENNHE